MKPCILSCLSLALLATGVLLLFEVIRPFRDLEMDGPMALASWGLGMILPGVAIWLKQGPFWLNLAALVLNALALAATLGLLYLIASSWRLF